MRAISDTITRIARARGGSSMPSAFSTAHATPTLFDNSGSFAVRNALVADRPGQVVGLAWFRVPVEGDRLAWSGAAVAAVRAGEVDHRIAARPLVVIGPRETSTADLRLSPSMRSQSGHGRGRALASTH